MSNSFKLCPTHFSKGPSPPCAPLVTGRADQILSGRAI